MSLWGKGAGRAPYLQIADALQNRIASGELKAGERLPAERRLCAELGVARGTVTGAYAELERRGLVRTAGGSGTYVLMRSVEHDREAALEASRLVAGRLHALHLSRREIEVLVREKLWEQLPMGARPQVAWVDCSEELLLPMARELEEACGVRVMPRLVREVVVRPELLTQAGYGAIITTIMHYEELTAISELRGLRYETAVLSLNRETEGALAQIPRAEGTRIAALYGTQPFRAIIERYLEEFGVCAPCDYCSIETLAGERFEAGRYAAVIVPPDAEYKREQLAPVLACCAEQGVRLISFTHVFDTGSLIHICEQLRRIAPGG